MTEDDLKAIEARANEDMLKGDISALCWLKGKAELAGRGTLNNLDARAVLRAIRQAEQAARAEADKRIEALESKLFDAEELLGVSEGQVNDLQRERADFHGWQTERNEQLAAVRADERRKVIEECAQIVNAARGEGAVDLRTLVYRIRALDKDPRGVT